MKYTFDEEERLHTVTDWNNKQTTFSYDNAGRLTGIAYANGTSATFGYDSENRVTSLYHVASGGGSHFVDRTNIRNAVGYKTQENISGSGELNPVPTARKIKQQTFDTADRLLTSTDQQGRVTTNSFNANGDLLSVVSSQSSVSCGWDQDNRLTMVSSNSSVLLRYQYDGLGNRIGLIDSNSTTNYFVVNQIAGLKNALARLDAPGTTGRYFVWGPAGLLSLISQDGTTFYSHADEQGSTLAVTDAGGVVVEQFAYSPYGEVTAHSGGPNTPYQWLGGLGVRADGYNLYFMLNRYYSADLKRFLSEDPSGIDSFPNLYAYGNLNPCFFVDPYGLSSWQSIAWNFTKGAVIGAGIAGAVVLAAPVVVSVGAAGLVAAGVSAATATTVASAGVTGGLLAAGSYGAYRTGVNTYQNVVAGNWDAVAYNVGNVAGGAAVGVSGGGRALAEGVQGSPSAAPNTWNAARLLQYEFANRYKLSMGPPGATWMATAPTPLSGGSAAAGVAAGLGQWFPPSVLSVK